MRKLIEEDDVSVNTVEGTYITFALVLTVIGGGVFVAGGNFFDARLPHHAFGAVLHCGCVFFALPVFRGWRRTAKRCRSWRMNPRCSSSPWRHVLGSGAPSDVAGVANIGLPMIVVCIPAFLALMFVLTIKLRKSAVRPVIQPPRAPRACEGRHDRNERSHVGEGRKVMHWCETTLFLGWVAMFFIWDNPVSIVLAVVVAALAFFLADFHRQQFRACEVAEVPEVGMEIVALACGLANTAWLVFALIA